MFRLRWSHEAAAQYEVLRQARLKAKATRDASGKGKSSRQEGLFGQVVKTVRLLGDNPRHPGLQTHKYSSLHDVLGREVFEAYAQNRTPGAYRVFWCYGPQRGEITILAITPHP